MVVVEGVVVLLDQPQEEVVVVVVVVDTLEVVADELHPSAELQPARTLPARARTMKDADNMIASVCFCLPKVMRLSESMNKRTLAKEFLV